MTRSVLHYTRTAKSLHWLMALIIIGLLASGLIMDELAMALKFKVIQLHKSFGLLVLMLVCARVMWRFTHPAPMLPKAMLWWQKAAAHGTHALLYVLMFTMPLAGWIMSDAFGYHPNFFGYSIVPMITDVNKPLGGVFHEVHEIGGYLFLVLLAAHVGAALYHHLIVKDDILLRMLPVCRKTK